MSNDADQQMADGRVAPSDHLPLSAEEREILGLWDQLQELRLEIAIINAQERFQEGSEDVSEDMSEDAAQAAQSALMEARSKLMLRNRVIESVLTANPILKAVHNGVNSSPIERDEGSIAVAEHAAKMGQVREELNTVQSTIFKTSRRNVQLTSNLLALIEDRKQSKPDVSSDLDTIEKTKQAERELDSSRRRWRVVKALTSGVVVGSGVNWASDQELEDVVLDPEDEEAGWQHDRPR